jgi:uncharacterized protein YfaP (DUF2135 family)
MKKIFVMTWALFLILGLSSCEKKNLTEAGLKDIITEEDITPATEEDIKAIETAHTQVKVIADQALLSDDPLATLGATISTIKKNPQVQDAWMTEGGMYVKYKKGGIVAWLVKSDMYKPPFLPKMAFLQNSKCAANANIVGNKKALFINQSYNDEGRNKETIEYTDQLFQMFYNQGFAVQQLSGTSFNLDFMDSELSKYGTVFLITHGDYDDEEGIGWLFTAEEANPVDLAKTDHARWAGKQIACGIIGETRGGTEYPISYVMVSDRFIEQEYEANEFPNSLIYTTACKFFQSNAFAKAFVAKGAGAVIGWNEINCVGLYSGAMLMHFMLGGLSVSEAFENVPAEALKDKQTGAQLTYYPSSGSSLHLIAESEVSLEMPALVVNSPVNGNAYAARVLTLSGSVSGAKTIKYGTVEVNGVATTLEASGLNFSQSIVINEGQNTINITCIVELTSGKTASALKTITINGNFPKLDLFTELRWNDALSDVDFHLLPPDADLGALFTGTDCYFNNLSPSWGATLDVDDRDGNGPEHIEIATSMQNGKYRLLVHYYDDQGAAAASGPIQAFASVSVRNGSMLNFGPYTLTNSLEGYNTNASGGDLYEVCTIEFPSGKVTPVEKLHFINRPSLQRTAKATPAPRR